MFTKRYRVDHWFHAALTHCWPNTSPRYAAAADRPARRRRRSGSPAMLGFERLEKRLPLDASALCVPPAELEQSSPPPAEDVRQELSTAESDHCAEIRVDGDGNTQVTNPEIDQQPTNDEGTNDGEQQREDSTRENNRVDASNDVMFGAEGEFGSFSDVDSFAVDTAVLHRQMLVYQQQNRSVAPSDSLTSQSEATDLFEPEFSALDADERIRRVAEREIPRQNQSLAETAGIDALTQTIRDQAFSNTAGTTLVRPAEVIASSTSSQLAVEQAPVLVQSEPETMGSAMTEQETSASPNGSIVDVGVDRSSTIDELLVEPLEALSGADEESAFERTATEPENDMALMSYLRNAELGLAPVVAGLAYALTQSLDRFDEPQPQDMSRFSNRRNRRRQVRS